MNNIQVWTVTYLYMSILLKISLLSDVGFKEIGLISVFEPFQIKK